MAARHPKAMAVFGEYLLVGYGGPKNTALGLVFSTDAANLGSNFAACTLGEAFFVGRHVLPKDPVQARFWLKKVVEGECEYKHLEKEWIDKSAEMLRELDE